MKDKQVHQRSLASTSITWPLLVMLLYFTASHLHELAHFPYRIIELRLQDAVAKNGHSAQRDERLVFLCDDEPSHALDALWEDELAASPALPLMKQRLWPRAVWAHVIDRLVGAGARVVVFDYMFQGEDPTDAVFREALDRHRDRVVVGSWYEDLQLAVARAPKYGLPVKTLVPEGVADPRVGFVTVWPDEDRVVRRAWYRITDGQVAQHPLDPAAPVRESLAARAVSQAGAGALVPAERKPFPFRFTYKGELLRGENKAPSLYTIFVPALWAANHQNGAAFRDKIVLIGPEGRTNKDLVRSPFGDVAGPEVHLNAMNALLTGDFLRETPLWVDLSMIAGGGLLAWLLGRFVRRPPLRVVLIALLTVAWFGMCILLFNAGWVVLVFSPSLALLGSGFLYTATETILERAERTRLRKTFERYVSRDVVKELVDNPESFLNLLGGARKNITVMFSDVRGFTSRTEGADPAALVAQLNEYFDEMVRIVFANDGTLDKFIGDAVMAHWGSIVSEGEPTDARRAVKTALEMRRALVRLNAQWKVRKIEPLAFGIGINHGEAIVGNLGCEAKMEVSVIGDAVNVASRLEGVTKSYHLDLVIGELVEPHVREEFVLRSVDLIKVKGRARGVAVFTVLDERRNGAEPAWLARHEDAVKLYRAGDFAGAAKAWREVQAQVPDDSIAEVFLKRCGELQAQPPEGTWDGVFEMKDK